MIAKVIETGEIVNVTPNPTWYKENGQGPDRREWDEDELEFIPSPNAPKWVSLDKVCEYLKKNLENDNDGHGYPKISIYKFAFVEDLIEDLKRTMEE